MSFYVAVHSDASRKTFTDNTAAKFTTRLSKPIILNSEYNVAVSSIIKYWRDGISAPLVASRLIRDAPAALTAKVIPPCGTVPQTFPEYQMSAATKQLLSNAIVAYLKYTPPIVFINDHVRNQIKLDLVDNNVVVATHTITPTQELCLTEAGVKQLTFNHLFTHGKYNIYVSYANDNLTVTIQKIIRIVKRAAPKPIAATTTPTTTPVAAKVKNAYRIRFYPQMKLKDFLFREVDVALDPTVPIRHVSVRNPANMPYRDLRDLKVYDFIMEFNCDAFQKYAAKSVSREEVLADVKIQFFPRHSYSMNEMIKGWGTINPHFKNIFQAVGVKAIPKYQKGKNLMYWMSKRICQALEFPEFVAANDGRQLIITVDDPELGRLDTFKTDIDDPKGLSDYVNTKVNIQRPYILKIVVTDTKLNITSSKHVKITLPYVFNYFTISCDEGLEQWPISISYQSSKSVDKIIKTASVERSSDVELQGKNIKDACHEETGDTDLEFRIFRNGKENTVTVDQKLEVTIPHELAKRLKIPTILKYVPVVEKATTKVEQPIWITCDLVDEMLVGEAAVKLLTPSPLTMDAEINSKQYVPVSSCRFSDITLYCYSDITTLAPYGGSEDFMVVLHFMPRYKRVRTFTENDTVESYKKFCCHYG